MNQRASSTCSEFPSPADEFMDDWLVVSSTSAGSQSPEGSREETEERSKLTSKLVSAWNSVKYGWSLKQKSTFRKTSPVIMLGNSYNLNDKGQSERFHHSFASLLWLTYRRGFPQLPGCSLTTDSGWGCLLRTGQMLLARGLLLHLMPQGLTSSVSHHVFKDDMDLPEIRPETTGVCIQNSKGLSKRGRTLSLGSLLDRRMESTHRRVVSWFADHPSAPFGIHQLVELGKTLGKKAGDWYGPSIVAHILRKASEASTLPPNLVVYVAQDCTIYKEDVKALCGPPSGIPAETIAPWKSVILLVPVRLGGQDLNPAYIACVKKLLKLQCCIGIFGGKPKHSLFFVGFQDDHLLYLDPHYCQPTVDITKDNFPLESFHCNYPRKMPFSRMDPSCTIGFYAKGQKDFEMLCIVVDEAVSTAAEMYPMFIFSEGHSQEEGESNTPTNNLTYIKRKNERRRVNTCNSMDEFVLL
ncbi:cysteine protease atg4da-like [Dunckerocampus dactyliophorus]|uniref:cysteine protease atg4da-like n=1 Tax=Dunckerocampus dactyliophorus TaxID=161453 RepID=UPI002406C99B|nr:cysteine protease atg4da-like [Dunckerocampus dactyliophorus]XP_054614723.1 cysteine protease atg4da-like [Dunckerocampus dactyliophorus]XP_054614724.1 cysteine protease atg4da-like [Dunckerocampus dactyliophorus]